MVVEKLFRVFQTNILLFLIDKTGYPAIYSWLFWFKFTSLRATWPTKEEELKDAILLVFANKQDSKGALNAQLVSVFSTECRKVEAKET